LLETVHWFCAAGGARITRSQWLRENYSWTISKEIGFKKYPHQP